MKRQVTRKYLKNLYGDDSIALGYCEMQNLFPEYQADYYTSGVYGWNFDGFCINGVLITTGYNGTFGTRPDRELTKEYEQKAIELKRNLTDYKEIQEKLYLLQKEFVNKVLNK